MKLLSAVAVNCHNVSHLLFATLKKDTKDSSASSGGETCWGQKSVKDFQLLALVKLRYCVQVADLSRQIAMMARRERKTSVLSASWFLHRLRPLSHSSWHRSCSIQTGECENEINKANFIPGSQADEAT
jgi:hypothetical protein